MPWEPGRHTVEYLLERGRLARLAPGGADESADAILERAGQRLATSRAALAGGDVHGSFVNAYDAYRMGAESLLARQSLRATGGDGAHLAVEDAVSSQFAEQIETFAKPTFDRFRRQRHAAQYFDPGQPEVTEADARWAIDLANDALLEVRRLSESSDLGPFPSS
jgi:hypothetical protein